MRLNTCPKNSKNLIQSPSDVSFRGSQQTPAAIKQGLVNSGSTELIQIGDAPCLPFKFHRVQIRDKQFSVDYKPQHSLQITRSCFTHSLLSALPKGISVYHLCSPGLFQVWPLMAELPQKEGKLQSLPQHTRAASMDPLLSRVPRTE